jgi:hypothetical protein
MDPVEIVPLAVFVVLLLAAFFLALRYGARN